MNVMPHRAWFSNLTLCNLFHDCRFFDHYHALAIRLRCNGWKQLDLYLLFETYLRLFVIKDSQEEHLNDILSCIWGLEVQIARSLFPTAIDLDALEKRRKELDLD